MLADDKRRYLEETASDHYYPVMIQYLWQIEQVNDGLWMLPRN